MMLFLLGLSGLVYVCVYVFKNFGEDDDDFYATLARTPHQKILTLQVLIVVGCLACVMGLMTGTYQK